MLLVALQTVLDPVSGPTAQTVAQSASDLEIAQFVVTVLWLVSTLLLLYLTYRTLKTSEKALTEARRATDHQFRVHDTDVLLKTYPALHITLRGSVEQQTPPETLRVTLRNVGDIPAYDVEWFFIRVIHHEVHDYDDQDEPIGVDYEDEYTLVERETVPVVPRGHEYQKSVRTARRGVDPMSWQIILQFRDATGSNHIENYVFSLYWYPDDDSRQEMKLNHRDARPLERHPRIELSKGDEESGKATVVDLDGEGPIPDYLSTDVIGAIEKRWFYFRAMVPEGKLVRSST